MHSLCGYALEGCQLDTVKSDTESDKSTATTSTDEPIELWNSPSVVTWMQQQVMRTSRCLRQRRRHW